MKFLKKFNRIYFGNKEKIETLIQNHLKFQELKVIPQDLGQSKIDIFITSDEFIGKSHIQRHRIVMGILNKGKIMDQVHAVTLKLKDK